MQTLLTRHESVLHPHPHLIDSAFNFTLASNLLTHSGRGSFATVYLGVNVDAPPQRPDQPESDYFRNLAAADRSQPAAGGHPTLSLPSLPRSNSSTAVAQLSTEPRHLNPSWRQQSRPNSPASLPHLSAIKSISRSRLDRRLSDSLDSEIRILRTIRHPNVVSLYHVEKTDVHIHLVMEYCAMGDLSHYIKRKGLVTEELERMYGTPPAPNASSGASQPPQPSPPRPPSPFAGPWGGLSEPVTRRMLGQLACALNFLRDHNLIHRDIKPQNLLLGWPENGGMPKNGERTPVPGDMDAFPVLKLADFGFARLLQPLSLASTLCGSPLYMAPEILRHHKYDARADLWSVGVVLYEMLCGRVPFRAKSQADLLRRIDSQGGVRWPDEVAAQQRDQQTREHAAAAAAGEPLLPSTPVVVPPPVPADMKDLVRRLLRRDPRDRMTFEEFFAHPCVVACIDSAGGLVLGTAPDEVPGGGEEGEGLQTNESDDEGGSDISDEDDVGVQDKRKGPLRDGATRIGPSGTARPTVSAESPLSSSPVSPPTIATKNPIHPPAPDRAGAGIMRRGSSGDGMRVVGLSPLTTQGVGLGTLVSGQERKGKKTVGEKREVEPNARDGYGNETAAAIAAERDPALGGRLTTRRVSLGHDAQRRPMDTPIGLPQPLPMPGSRTDATDRFYSEAGSSPSSYRGTPERSPAYGASRVEVAIGAVGMHTPSVLPTPPETLPGTLQSDVGELMAQAKAVSLGQSGSPSGGSGSSATLHPHQGHVGFSSGSRSIPVAIASAVAEHSVFASGSPGTVAGTAIHSASPPPLLAIQPGTAYSPGYFTPHSGSRSSAIPASRRTSVTQPSTPSATPPGATSSSFGARSPLAFVEGVFKVIPQSVAVWRSNSTGSGQPKSGRQHSDKSSSSDEYVIVSKGAVEVEWLADEVAALTGARISSAEDRERSVVGYPSASPSLRDGMASSASLRRHVSASAGMRSHTASPTSPMSPAEPRSPHPSLTPPESLDQLVDLLRRTKILQAFADDVRNSKIDLSSLIPGSHGTSSSEQPLSQPQSLDPSPTSSAFHTAMSARVAVAPMQQLAAPVYVRLLSHYQRCSDYARKGWDELRRRSWGVMGPGGGVGSMNKEDVQWLSGMVKQVRDGFVLSLEEAEKGLGRQGNEKQGNGVNQAIDDDDLSSTKVEIVIYEGVLEMARSGAYAEMRGDALQLISETYARAVSLLEVLIQDDDDARSRHISGMNPMTDEDRGAIEELLQSLKARYGVVSRKLEDRKRREELEASPNDSESHHHDV
ncbi:Serine/threonine-protein kinase [Gonapodya sp. JEL0774]|nr:Serine/threonine-protein kinase [Gonapodya sp. JEL0774]